MNLSLKVLFSTEDIYGSESFRPTEYLSDGKIFYVSDEHGLRPVRHWRDLERIKRYAPEEYKRVVEK